MNCPHCDFYFKVLVASGDHIPELAPIICENCAEVSLLLGKQIFIPSQEQMDALKQSPAWDFISRAKGIILANKMVH